MSASLRISRSLVSCRIQETSRRPPRRVARTEYTDSCGDPAPTSWYLKGSPSYTAPVASVSW